LALLFLCTVVSAQTAKTARAATEECGIQVYLGDSHASAPRPEKEWKGFANVNLQPGESKQLSATLDQRAFSFYDVGKRDWSAEPGECSILAGSSSANIKLQGKYLLNRGQETR
jgi:beta-glucosidase